MCETTLWMSETNLEIDSKHSNGIQHTWNNTCNHTHSKITLLPNPINAAVLIRCFTDVFEIFTKVTLRLSSRSPTVNYFLCVRWNSEPESKCAQISLFVPRLLRLPCRLCLLCHSCQLCALRSLCFLLWFVCVLWLCCSCSLHSFCFVSQRRSLAPLALLRCDCFASDDYVAACSLNAINNGLRSTAICVRIINLSTCSNKQRRKSSNHSPYIFKRNLGTCSICRTHIQFKTSQQSQSSNS